MRKSTILAFAASLGCVLGVMASPAIADPHKDESGHGRFGKHYEHGKEEFWDHGCKVERKWKKDGEYKEKRKCRAAPYAEADAQVEAQPTVVITLPPVVISPAAY